MSFRLRGDPARLRIPARRLPRFRNGLWRHTCFEVFVARRGSRAYREYNLSPSGEWAAYAFKRYRIRAREALRRPFFRVSRDLALSIRLPERGRVRIGLAAVIEEEGGRLSYWALRHAGARPDFHHPGAFALELA